LAAFIWRFHLLRRRSFPTPFVAAALAAVLGCASSAGPQASGNAGAQAGSAAQGGGATVAGTAGALSGGAAGAGGTSATAGSGGAAGGVGGASGAAGTGGTAALTGNVNIMVLGSSNELITCWRAFLWQKLETAGITNFHFVGGVTSGPDCGVAGYDKDLQAQSGIIISNLPASKFQEWFTAHPPDIILMHFGGADLLNNMPIDGILKAYSLALAQARLVKSKVRLLIAQHTPQNSTGVPELNASIVTWAAANTTPDSPVTPIDLFTGIDPATDLSDGVHLNPTGSQKVAERWFAALKPLFKP
jgi:hypothetical protein